jgi:hypothetical protein
MVSTKTTDAADFAANHSGHHQRTTPNEFFHNLFIKLEFLAGRGAWHTFVARLPP